MPAPPNVLSMDQLLEKISPLIGEAVNKALKDLPDLDVTKKGMGDLAAILAAARGTTATDPGLSLIAPGVEKGVSIARIITSLANTKGDIERAKAWAQKTWKDQPGLDVLTKALSTDNATAGGFLVRDAISNEVIELLRPASVVDSLNPIQITMGAAQYSVPKLAGGATAYFIGENEDIPITQPETGTVRLRFHKLAAIVPMSNDMLRYAAPGSEAIVRDDAVAALAQRADLAKIRGDGTNDSIKGLKSFCPSANKIPANGTVNLANVTNDLATLVLTLMEANVRMLRPGWIFPPRVMMYLATVRDGLGNYAFRDEIMRGVFWGYPFKTTTQIPINLGGGGDESEIYLADFADIVIGRAMDLTIDTSTDATYVGADGALKSLFSKDQTAVRLIQEFDMGVRHDASIAMLTAVDWAPGL